MNAAAAETRILVQRAQPTGESAVERNYVHGFRQFDIYDDETRHVFGASPACNVKYQRVLDAALRAKHLRPVVAEARTESCTVRYGVKWWRTSTPFDRCVVMVHENGHLLGLSHDDADRFPVMHSPPNASDACSSLVSHERWLPQFHYTWTYVRRARSME